jgi:ribonuclease E
MAKKMLIDASHPEVTRIAVLDGSSIEEFDQEPKVNSHIKGNIYLAKVTRVEPSLQAAFVEYGGNKQGFLSFNEIHPDYFRIPMSDRPEDHTHDQIEMINDEFAPDDDSDEVDSDFEPAAVDEGIEIDVDDQLSDEELDDSELLLDESVIRSPTHFQIRKKYSIQEVIKRRQILLVQATKEERGNKGAALTTYISLPGRYCVFMPNTEQDSGGISRKIADVAQRRKLKSTMEDLDIADGVSVIIRTAGEGRSKAEIKRDYDSLNRLWENIRSLTLESTAPCLVYEEGDLIRRSLRDLYSRDIDEVVVAGDEAFKTTRQIMRMMIPSHVKKVKEYGDDKTPIFQKYNVEDRLSSVLDPTVQLPSGGYIVINQTEALVAIDVNSGRATRERNIEETAFKTNMEAAQEIARQLKLRDLAGLIVIDFIDMMSSRNQMIVARKVRDSIKNDRARIQIGRISQFGLLEMSRQRLRPSILETSSMPCPHCMGIGMVKTLQAQAFDLLRKIEQAGFDHTGKEITLVASKDMMMDLLNTKKSSIDELEKRYELKIVYKIDDTLSEAEIETPVVKKQPEPKAKLKREPRKPREPRHKAKESTGENKGQQQRSPRQAVQKKPVAPKPPQKKSIPGFEIISSTDDLSFLNQPSHPQTLIPAETPKPEVKAPQEEAKTEEVKKQPTKTPSKKPRQAKPQEKRAAPTKQKSVIEIIHSTDNLDFLELEPKIEVISQQEVQSAETKPVIDEVAAKEEAPKKRGRGRPRTKKIDNKVAEEKVEDKSAKDLSSDKPAKQARKPRGRKPASPKNASTESQDAVPESLEQATEESSKKSSWWLK